MLSWVPQLPILHKKSGFFLLALLKIINSEIKSLSSFMYNVRLILITEKNPQPF